MIIPMLDCQASLQTFKHAFVSKDVLFVIVGMLEEPLSHVGVARSEDDNFCIELCLTLLRNVLSIRDPPPGAVKSPGDQYTEMHGQLLALLQDTLLLDILLLLAQDVHARENASLNLLLVEIFHSIVRDHDPTAVVTECRGKVKQDVTGGPTKQPSQRKGPGGSLTALLAREKTARGSVSGQMHRYMSCWASGVVQASARVVLDQVHILADGREKNSDPHEIDIEHALRLTWELKRDDAGGEPSSCGYMTATQPLALFRKYRGVRWSLYVELDDPRVVVPGRTFGVFRLSGSTRLLKMGWCR